MNDWKEAFDKTEKVIRSCKTRQQLAGAGRYVVLLEQSYGNSFVSRTQLFNYRMGKITGMLLQAADMLC